jgi:stress response protein YsnF
VLIKTIRIMRQTVFGIFDKASEAQNAVKHLMDQGFTQNEIDVHSTREGAETSKTKTETKSKPKERNSDGYMNFFSNLFAGDDDTARTYSDVARRGSVVTVHTSSAEDSERAAEILDRFGAIDVNEKAAKYRAEGTFGTNQTGNMGNTADANSIPVIEEEMEVGKRRVETGGVRLRSRIIERPVEETLRLREEHVNVERNPVDRPATDADLQNFKEGETTFTEHAEKPVVNKEARVVEEVNLNKETKDRERTIRDSVRKTEVDVKKTSKDEERRNR